MRGIGSLRILPYRHAGSHMQAKLVRSCCSFSFLPPPSLRPRVPSEGSSHQGLMILLLIIILFNMPLVKNRLAAFKRRPMSEREGRDGLERHLLDASFDIEDIGKDVFLGTNTYSSTTTIDLFFIPHRSGTSNQREELSRPELIVMCLTNRPKNFLLVKVNTPSNKILVIVSKTSSSF